MQYLGEIISLVVAVLWTATALFANEASRRIGAMSANFFRMAFSGVLLAGLLWVTIGHPYPAFADGKTWLWMALSALVGYVFGDFCLFNSYVVIGARFGQLFMTLAPVFAAFAGWALLGETLSWRSWLAMVVTLSGIAISILSRSGEGHKLALKLPLKGVLLGVGAGMGQGVGLVLSKIGLQHYAEALPADDAPDLEADVGALSQMAVGAVSLREAEYLPGVRVHGNREVLERIFVRKPVFNNENF